MPSNTRIKPILAFNKNETPLLIRLKVPFPSSLFLAVRVKKLQITFSSRLTSFSTNSNKVWIDFTHNFVQSAPGLLSEKCFSRNRSCGHPSWHWPIRVPQEPSEIVSWRTEHKQEISGKPNLFLVHNIPVFTKPCHFLYKINLVFM